MIVSFRDRLIAEFAAGETVRKFSAFARQAEVRLDRLEAATPLADLAALPGNRLEALRGNRSGQYSTRINEEMADLVCLAGRIARPDGRGNRRRSLKGSTDVSHRHSPR